MSILLAIVALGVLILVHELGHYLAAKACGVYVERFSIGFGPKLLSKTKGDTEYCISAIPLGGYVKLHRMVEEEEPIAGKEDGAFFSKPYYKKIIVISAGVFFNVLFAVLLLSIAFTAGYKAHSPVVGTVAEGKAGDRGGFLAGDRIKDVGGESIRSWEGFITAINERRGEFSVGVERNGNNIILNLIPDETEYTNPLGEKGMIADTGMSAYIEPVVGGLTPGYPAEKAGIEKDDRFVSINGEQVRDWDDVVKIVRANPGVPLELVMERQGTEYSVTATPETSGEGAEAIGMLGIISSDGDITLREAPWTALGLGTERTVYMAGLIYKGIGQLISGKVSRENIGGPILIVQETANSAKDGLERYLTFTAFISINLAVLNLLPVPILDGGYVVMYTYERIMRRKISPAVQKAGMMVGMALLGVLMVFAFYNDIMRFIF